jgi:hypothetical protein
VLVLTSSCSKLFQGEGGEKEERKKGGRGKREGEKKAKEEEEERGKKEGGNESRKEGRKNRRKKGGMRVSSLSLSYRK